MEISENKMQIVIDNYFKSECDINTSIRSAFEKGFRIGVKKASSSQPDLTAEEWELVKKLRSYHNGSYAQVLDKLIAVASQPEITHCRDCAKLQTDNIFHDHWCDGKRVRLDHYCGDAKRWEE